MIDEKNKDLKYSLFQERPSAEGIPVKAKV